LLIFIKIQYSFEIWVSWAIFYSVTYLSTTDASLLFCFTKVMISFILISKIIIFFGFMFLELATRCVSVSFTATPPHLSTPIWLVGTAWPIKILLLIKFLATFFTSFICRIELAFSLYKLSNPLFHLFFFFKCLFVHSFNYQIFIY